MKEYSLDLHIHSVLSPCASDEMLPAPLLGKARELGLDAVAIADHNTGENVRVFMDKGRELGVKVFPAMELQTAEDIHLICLFENPAELLQFQELVYAKLPCLKNNRISLGEQWLLNEEGLKCGELDRLLLVGTSLTVEEGAENVHKLGGLCLAAHLDRQAFSLWGHLADLPEELDLDGAELTPHLRRDPQLLEAIKQRGFSYVVSSDAHYLSDLRPPQCFARLQELTIAELKQALKGQNGRQIRTTR